METTNPSRSDLVARYRELSRAMANELMSDSDMNALRRERDQVQQAINAIDEESSR